MICTGYADALFQNFLCYPGLVTSITEGHMHYLYYYYLYIANVLIFVKKEENSVSARFKISYTLLFSLKLSRDLLFVSVRFTSVYYTVRPTTYTSPRYFCVYCTA